MDLRTLSMLCITPLRIYPRLFEHLVAADRVNAVALLTRQVEAVLVLLQELQGVSPPVEPPSWCHARRSGSTRRHGSSVAANLPPEISVPMMRQTWRGVF